MVLQGSASKNKRVFTYAKFENGDVKNRIYIYSHFFNTERVSFITCLEKII